MKSDSSDQHEEPRRDSLPLLKQMIEQTRLLAQIRHGVEQHNELKTPFSLAIRDCQTSRASVFPELAPGN
jgi:hypothetical protein